MLSEPMVKAIHIDTSLVSLFHIPKMSWLQYKLRNFSICLCICIILLPGYYYLLLYWYYQFLILFGDKYSTTATTRRIIIDQSADAVTKASHSIDGNHLSAFNFSSTNRPTSIQRFYTSIKSSAIQHYRNLHEPQKQDLKANNIDDTDVKITSSTENKTATPSSPWNLLVRYPISEISEIRFLLLLFFFNQST